MHLKMYFYIHQFYFFSGKVVEGICFAQGLPATLLIPENLSLPLFHLLNLSFRYLFFGHHLLSMSASDVYQSHFHNSSALLGFSIQSPPNAHCPLAQVQPQPDESLCNALRYQTQHEKCLPEWGHAAVLIPCSIATITLSHPSCPYVFPCLTSDLSSQPL